MTIIGNSKPCPFCSFPTDHIVDENEHATPILDAYPVSHGHRFIIPKRHVGSFPAPICPRQPPHSMQSVAILPRCTLSDMLMPTS